MTLRVVTAATDAAWEERLVRAFAAGRHGVEVVRRCVDVSELLATAATGVARAALLGAELHRLDRDAVLRLTGSGIAVVAVVPAEDEAAERRARLLGVRHVVTADTEAAAVAERLVAAVAGAGHEPSPYGDQAAPDDDDATLAPGRVVAVWGSSGAPGRTTVAVTIAAEIAAIGCSALLVDADVDGGTVAPMLGLLDEGAGIAVAARLANSGALDRAALARAARAVTPGLRVLTGVRAARWRELRPGALEVVLDTARHLAAVTIVDCAASLDPGGPVGRVDGVPARGAVTRAVVAAADTVVVVGLPDPVSLQRLVRALADLREVTDLPPLVLVNRMRAGAPAAAEVTAALRRYAGVEPRAFVPLDLAACDAAVARGATLLEAAPGSPTRSALRAVAAEVAGRWEPPPDRRLRDRLRNRLRNRLRSRPAFGS